MSFKDKIKNIQKNEYNPIELSRQTPIDRIYYERYASAVCFELKRNMKERLKYKPQEYKSGFFSKAYKYTASYLIEFRLSDINPYGPTHFYHVNHEGLYVVNEERGYDEDSSEFLILLYTKYLEDIEKALYYLMELLNSEGFDEIYFTYGCNHFRFTDNFINKIVSEELNIICGGKKSLEGHINVCFNCDSSGKLI